MNNVGALAFDLRTTREIKLFTARSSSLLTSSSQSASAPAEAAALPRTPAVHALYRKWMQSCATPYIAVSVRSARSLPGPGDCSSALTPSPLPLLPPPPLLLRAPPLLKVPPLPLLMRPLPLPLPLLMPPLLCFTTNVIPALRHTCRAKRQDREEREDELSQDKGAGGGAIFWAHQRTCAPAGTSRSSTSKLQAPKLRQPKLRQPCRAPSRPAPTSAAAASASSSPPVRMTTAVVPGAHLQAEAGAGAKRQGQGQGGLRGGQHKVAARHAGPHTLGRQGSKR